MSKQTTAELLAAARERAYAPDRDAELSRPTMIGVDLSNGTTAYIARCCDNPAPRCLPVGQGKTTKHFHADVVCDSCGCTLAVFRWRLDPPG